MAPPRWEGRGVGEPFPSLHTFILPAGAKSNSARLRADREQNNTKYSGVPARTMRKGQKSSGCLLERNTAQHALNHVRSK
eukprot:1168422-Alexandrium_andersonii.AAC.1